MMPAGYAYVFLYLRAEARERGQDRLAISQATIAASMGLTRHVLTRCFKRLIKLGFIRIETDGSRALIHIVNITSLPPDVKPSEPLPRQERASAAPKASVDSGVPQVEKPQKNFVKPSPADVQIYAHEVGLRLNGEEFCDFYESKGWMIGKNHMKDWKAAVRTWKNKAQETEPARLIKPKERTIPASQKEHHPKEEDLVQPSDIHDLVVKLAGGARRIP